MPGKRPRDPIITIPPGVLVRDRSTGRMGILIAYGKRAARVRTRADEKWGVWFKLRHLEQVSQQEIDELLRKEAEDLV